MTPNNNLQKVLDEMKMKIVPVRRIVRVKDEFIKCTVDFKYYYDGKGPFDIRMQPFREVPKDGFLLTLKWILGGFKSV